MHSEQAISEVLNKVRHQDARKLKTPEENFSSCCFQVARICGEFLLYRHYSSSFFSSGFFQTNTETQVLIS